MRTTLDCIPCYLKQVMNTLNQLNIEPERSLSIMYDILPVIPTLDPTASPAETSSEVLFRAYQGLGVSDPFAKSKLVSNRLALDKLPSLRQKILHSSEPLYTASLISVAGNIIDLGILPDYDLDASLEEALSTDFAINDYPAFQQQLSPGVRLLFLGDNSGEIAFDRLLVEVLKAQGVNITYVVKGSPILNDATREDADLVKMDEVATVIDNGNPYLGTILSRCSPALIEAFTQADIVISKGQANYESLESSPEAGTKTFFLLRAKCPVVAEHLGVKLGDIVFKQNSPGSL